ncbi:hypothetical protein C9374_003965 [Naegleria lovaniensis]|uniref:Uncharacterized protein n=1 Tax=Naegleria lovaniensis TaxID=51637 RepID=A0AA88H5Z8_NAELO|nr:uncharacterized protein C9374_003965 [Naegleria lovaniensis]KAG2394201.1 hypothetical protein C9374_003965 [Naegleria lovaniensis]
MSQQQRLTSQHAIQSYYSTEASPYDPTQFQNDDANLTEMTQEETKSKQSKVKESILLYVATVVMVLARSVDFVLYVRMTKKMRNYEYMLADVFLSLGFCFVSWPVTWFKMFRGTITKEMRAFPSYKFIVMGIMDSLNVLISTIPSALVSGPVNVLMSQSVVFINMVASFVFLHFRYNVYHIGGVILVMIGITIDIFPLFANTSGGDDPNAWLWILLLFVSNIPAAASNVYKEKYLKEANLDVFYLNSWVALYQFIFGLMSVFTVFIPLPDSPYVDPANLYEYMWSGIKCFFGFNSVLSDQCDFFWLVFMVFICFNMTYNILLLVVFKRGSSTLAVVASVARLALSNFGFLIKFLAGEAYLEALSPFDIIALVILILGIIIYSLTSEKIADKHDPIRKVYAKIFSIFPRFNRKKDQRDYNDEENLYHDQ